MVVQHAGRDLQDGLGEDGHHVGGQDADLVQTIVGSRGSHKRKRFAAFCLTLAQKGGSFG